ECRTTGVERTEQIDVDDGLEPVGGHAECRRGKVSGGSAHDDVDFSMRIARAFNGGCECVVIAHVSRMVRCGTASARYLANCRVELLFRAAYQRNRGTMLGEASSDREIDPTTTAGNEGLFSFEEPGCKSFGHQPSKDKHIRRARKPTYGVKSLKVVSLRLHSEEVSMRGSFTLILFVSTACATVANNTRNAKVTEASLIQAD